MAGGEVTGFAAMSVRPERSRGTWLGVSRLRLTRTVLAVVGALVFAAPAMADSGLPAARWANEQLPDPRQEAQAKALMEELRCLVCQGQSIADSNAELAGDMRAMVRQRIASGEKPEAVRAWLIERYGNWVSYRPPVEPLTWPLWAGPILLLLAGAWLLRKRLVRRRG
jgi:cytochrome c-type biogenesis protein CcmH